MSESPANEVPKVETKGGIVAYLFLEGAAKAAEFYTRALGAEVVAQQPPDALGRTLHIHLHLNGASLMLSDIFAEHGTPDAPPSGFTLTLIVQEIDTWWARAIAAGCTPLTPPEKMFWGDTYAQMNDPFGVMWAMNQPA